MECLDVKINRRRIKVQVWRLFFGSDKQKRIKGEIRSWEGQKLNPLCGKRPRIAEIISDQTGGLRIQFTEFKIEEQKIYTPITDPSCIQFTAKAVKMVFGRPVFC